MLDSAYCQKTDEILEKYPREERLHIPVIHGVQDAYHCLPPGENHARRTSHPRGAAYQTGPR